MTTPTVPVTVTLAAQDGTPYVGLTVRARLDGNEIYEGFVISDQAEAVTDAVGEEGEAAGHQQHFQTCILAGRHQCSGKLNIAFNIQKV